MLSLQAPFQLRGRSDRNHLSYGFRLSPFSPISTTWQYLIQIDAGALADMQMQPSIVRFDLNTTPHAKQLITLLRRPGGVLSSLSHRDPERQH